MDFQRDYVLRMIEMMGDFLRRVKELINDLSRMDLMNQMCRKNCGMPLNAARALSTDSLNELLPAPSRLWLSEIWYAQANYTKEGIEEKKELLYRCFTLLLSMGEGQEAACEARGERLNELLKELDERLTSREWMEAAAFLIRGGAYGWAEDAAFEAVLTAPEWRRGEWCREAQKLVGGLLMVSDEGLAAGGLPRLEVEESLRDLRRLEQKLMGEHT